MIDRNKVIKGLEIERECASRDCDRDCARCDLVQDREWLLSVYDDALELLKEQEAVEPREQEETRTWIVCGNCSQHLISKWLWCPYCGRKVKWECD